jgi:hypothetical protein
MALEASPTPMASMEEHTSTKIPTDATFYIKSDSFKSSFFGTVRHGFAPDSSCQSETVVQFGTICHHSTQICAKLWCRAIAQYPGPCAFHINSDSYIKSSFFGTVWHGFAPDSSCGSETVVQFETICIILLKFAQNCGADLLLNIR